MAPTPDDNMALVRGVLLFIFAGVLMVVGALLAGALIRRRVDMPQKGEPYECGEPTVGPGWVQFDLRFYVIGLVFVIADVIAMLFYPWAVVMKQFGVEALLILAAFFVVIGVGYVYLWRFGYLDWVRSDAQKHHA